MPCDFSPGASDTTVVRTRVPLLVGLAALLGSQAARIHERAKEIPPAEAVATSAPAATPAPATAPERTEPPRARELPSGLPRYEVLGSTASPDGRSWCILTVSLEERVPARTLRALWASLKEEQATAWSRFTCRVYLHDMDCFGDSWADVNEITILESVPCAPPSVKPEELPAPQVYWEDDCCFLDFDGLGIWIDKPLERATWSGDGKVFWIPYTDPRDGRPGRVRVEAPGEWVPPPRCASASFR